MYVTDSHQVTDVSALHDLIDAHPLATWIVSGDDGPVAHHVPMLLDRSRGPLGTLTAHVARANPLWTLLDTCPPSLLVFHGPEAFITPSWYPSKKAHGKVVPTWNYAVVHARGVARVIHDPHWLLHHLDQLTTVHEAASAEPWALADAPEGFVERLAEAIVGIEIPIATLVGKWKVSQNRPQPDRDGVVAGLAGRGTGADHAMARLVADPPPSPRPAVEGRT